MLTERLHIIKLKLVFPGRRCGSLLAAFGLGGARWGDEVDDSGREAVVTRPIVTHTDCDPRVDSSARQASRPLVFGSPCLLLLSLCPCRCVWLVVAVPPQPWPSLSRLYSVIAPQSAPHPPTIPTTCRGPSCLTPPAAAAATRPAAHRKSLPGGATLQ